MSFLDITKATLSTLSPVHLGCGEDFLPTNYVIDGELLHHFNTSAVAEVMHDQLTEIKKIINSSDGANMVLRIRDLVYQKRQLFAIASPYHIPVAQGFIKHYENVINKAAQVEKNGSEVLNQLAVMRTFINPHSHQPIVTGSAIKGAIRTAILNNLAMKDRLYRPADVRDAKKLPNKLLGFSNPTDDPMKLLKISDAEYAHADNLPASEVLLTVSRQRQNRKEKKGSGISTYVEAISAYRRQAFNFDIRRLKNDDVENQKLVPKNAQEIAQICNDYYLPKITKEINELNQLSYLSTDYVRGVRDLLNGELGAALSDNRAFLLRLGKHSGAYYKTLDNLRQIHIPQENLEKKYVSDPFEVRLAASKDKDQETGLMPFGWVVVALNDFDLPKTYTFLDEQANSSGAITQHQHVQKLLEQRANLPRNLSERILAYQNFEKLQKEAEDAKQAEAEAAATVTTLQYIEAYLAKKSNRQMTDETYLLDELEKQNSIFSDLALKKAAAQYLQDILKKQGDWVEQSSSNKAERKKYERTVRIKRFL